MSKYKKQNRLKMIEDAAYQMGEKAKRGFEKSNNLNSLRGAVAAYRCSMQAMRDQMRYAVPEIKK